MFSSPSDPIHALAYPLALDEDRGRFTKTLDYERYVQDLVLQTLMTAPGERINRPEMGTPIPQLLFASINEEVADLVKAQIRRAMARWLDKVVRVEGIEIRQPEPTRFEIEVSYVILATGTTDVLKRTMAQ
ncbi:MULTISPECIES: GPW/gp25 family protein [Microbulbifer]|uniref:GPW/gp25 family protein n=1 Tax=Microbulbifer TaxID=48073 RepID=UPI001E53387A|nr:MULTISPECIES: GPW/gp25 family protein [Microbulbifer]UHQ55354.1 GPW/gp25 family protein [Microbulbifer sp. YPW16]